MPFNFKLTPAMVKALGKGLAHLVGAFGRNLAGTLMLVLVILSIGAAGALFHMQVVLA